MSKTLIIIGIILIAIRLAWLAGEKFGPGRSPGDIVFERYGVWVYISVVMSLIISLALSFMLWFFSR